MYKYTPKTQDEQVYLGANTLLTDAYASAATAFSLMNDTWGKRA